MSNNALSEALDLFGKTLSEFTVACGYQPTHLRCSLSFRRALGCGDYILPGVRPLYIRRGNSNRISPRFFIDDVMIDCVLMDKEMRLEVVDTVDFHAQMMAEAGYQLE